MTTYIQEHIVLDIGISCNRTILVPTNSNEQLNIEGWGSRMKFVSYTSFSLLDKRIQLKQYTVSEKYICLKTRFNQIYTEFVGIDLELFEHTK